MKKRDIIVLLLLALTIVLAAGCGGNASSGNASNGNSGSGNSGGGAAAPRQGRHFPQLSVPSVYANNNEAAQEYVAAHYWDAFFGGEGNTSADTILGVADEEVEQALANYLEILQRMKLQATPDNPRAFQLARGGVKTMFSKLEARQNADTSSRTYLRFTEMVTKYLYDPNSPMRDEDLYLPFAEGMEKSACTRDDMRYAAAFEASQCRKNGFGQTARNFSYKDARGNRGSLYAVAADYTMLFFSNPGCASCKEIIDEIDSRGFVRPMMRDKRLAIVNIYIDEEVQKWREYLHNYPKEWINGYDFTFTLRDGPDYDVRAIPSLYLLDAQKRVIMKDAPTARVLNYLENIYNQ